MGSAVDTLIRGKSHLRARSREAVAQDLHLVRRGVLDWRSFLSGYRKHHNPVELAFTTLVRDGEDVDPGLIVRDPGCFTDPVVVQVGRDRTELRDRAFGHRRRRYTAIRRQHNLRVTMGRDQWQIPLMFGDLGSSLQGLAVAYTGTTATTLTGASGLPTGTSTVGNTGLQGHLLYVQHSTFANSVVAPIVSNTATAITVDQWYALPVTGAAGTTPANGAGNAWVLPGMFPMQWVGLSTSVAAAAAGDVLRSADGLFGDGTTSGAATEQSTNGLSRAFVGYGGSTNPTFSAGQFNALHTWTYTGSSSVVLGKVVLCNSKAVVGSLLGLETLLNATGTVNANGDTITLNTWQINL